ncbi:hypothetical protein LguiB_008915 [Lonicera macranthoides]
MKFKIWSSAAQFAFGQPDLPSCEGKCLRSFHAIVDAGSDSICESLGLSDEQVVVC